MELRSQMLHDKDRGRISCYARDNHTIITQGSFELKQGGYGIAVLDHGRIVESQQYGRVFYVLFMDWEAMHIHYSDKFSG